MSDIKETIARDISESILRIIGMENMQKTIQMNILDPSFPQHCNSYKFYEHHEKVNIERGIYAKYNLDIFDEDDEKIVKEAWTMATKNHYFVQVEKISSKTEQKPKEQIVQEQADNRINRKGQTTDVQVTTLEEKTEQPENLPSEKDIINTEIKKFNLADSEIAKLKEKYSPLVITGVDDHEGYQAVEEALKVMVKKRTGVEKVRKGTKDFYVKVGKAIDGEAKRITALLTPIEESLSSKKLAIDNELANLERAAEKKKQDTLNYRIIELAKYNYAADVTALGEMTDEAFGIELEYAKQEFEKEKERKAKLDEQEAQLKKEREEFENQKKQHGFPSGSVSFGTGGSNLNIGEGLLKKMIIDDNETPAEEGKEESLLVTEKDPFDEDVYSTLEPAPAKPTPIAINDFTPIVLLAKEYIDYVDSDEYSHNNDFQERIVEQVINMVYGYDGMKFVKERRP